MAGARQPGGERCGSAPNAASAPTETVTSRCAEVAVGVELDRRPALYRRMVAIDRIGDQRRRRVGGRRVGGEHRDGIGDAEREGAAARARRGDAADAVAMADADRAASRRHRAEGEIAGDGDVEHLARRAKDGDVAAVVDVGAVERRGGAHDRHQLVRDGAGDRRHRRHEDVRKRRARREHAAADRAFRRRAVADGCAQRGAAPRRAPAGWFRSVALPRDAPARPPPACRKLFSTTSIGPCERCRRPPVSSWIVGAPIMAVTRAFAGAPGTSRLPPPRAARASAAIPRRRPPSSQASRHGLLRSARGSPAAHRSRRTDCET